MLGTAFAAPALAADDGESIVVTATRLPKSAATSASLSTLTADDLARRQSAFLVDALTALPGVSVSQNGGFGGQAALRLRGAGTEQTLVLVDGVVVNDVTSPGGGYDFSSFDPASVQRVDVLRGPQSTLWGSDAIGGVVSIVTKRPEPGFHAAAFLEGGSYSTIRGGAAVSGSAGAFDGRIGFSGIDTDGISKADERDGNPETDPYRSWTLDGRIGVSLGQGARVEVFGRYTDSTAHYDGFSFPTGVGDSDEVTHSKESLEGIVGRFDLFGGRLQNIVQVSHTELKRADFSSGFFSFGADGERTAYRYQGTLKFGDTVTTVFGAEYERNHSDDGFDAFSIDSTGLFALVEWRPVEALTLSGGIRNDDHSRFGDKTTGSLGAAWAPAPWVTLKANWSQGFKAPTIFQLTSFFSPATAPNPNLQAEEAEGYDAGAEFSVFEDRLKASVTYFHLDTTNLIQFANGGYYNVARAKAQGIEVEAAAKLTGTVTLRASYTYTDSKNAATDRRLIRVPYNTGFVELAWQPMPELQLGAQLRYTGKEKDSVRPANPQGVIGDWTRLDLTASYAINQSVEVYGRVENVTDEQYQSVFGYGEPGRSAYGGVRLRFD